jgi:hypothetical protein
LIEHEYNEQGIYGAVCYVNGCKHEVLVDDHVPCKGYAGQWSPKFAQAHGPELWVIILEKVWAKIHGSYDRISGG